ncbi:beta-alanine-activating enzyme [Achroia grisella]|uniref:beta-alanine-activating enzyme n=1 Tax=Achroia grisella TaxID=688607 RepID=UPI0027D3322C|nr:beta-alanine-activating enzyme [Achroia grisella]
MKFKRGYYDVFLRTCAKSPSSIAVRHYENGVYRSYTYSELYGVCEYISQNLQQIKCNKGIIGLISKRNIIIPSVIAAAHKCCTTFMFLDPTQDIESVANDMKFRVVIYITNKEKALKSEFFNKKPDKTVTIFNLFVYFYNFEHLNSAICIPEYSFIAMTSGSTGEPKHIQVPVQCIQPNVDDLTKLFNITSNDVIYFSTPLTFDPSMIEILIACLNGASLLIAPEKAEILFPENRENSVTFWQLTPSRFFQYSNADIRNKILSPTSTLKILALGGEPLNGVKRLKELKDANNKTRIYTLYGVTEMSCWACVAELDLSRMLSDKEIPLGNCLSETELHVEPNVDNKESGKIVLISKTRKCIILNKSNGNEEESSLKFIDTGDLAEVKNGNVYYRGRKDDIIKRFGHKINLQYIESSVMQCPRVKTSSCIWLPKPSLLVVYFSSETLSSQELSDFLKCKLDDKHWPDKIIRADNLPTNPHGKMSKLLLSKMYEETVNMPLTLDSLRVSFLKELQIIMSKVNLTYEEIKDKDFFSIGGTSFLAVSMCNKLSLSCPKLGNLILPYLVSQKTTIDDILQLVHKETCDSEIKVKKKIKRTYSDAHSCTQSQSYKRSNTESSTNLIEFILLWTSDTGKCVDASPLLFQIGFNLYAIVGSHSGKIVVVDAISGILQGTLIVNSRIEASVFCYHKKEMSPCAVVGAHDGTVLCFALETCNEIWRINIGSMIKSKATCCNDLFYIASYDGRIRCIDVMTGEIKETIHIADQGISANLVLAKNKYVLLGTLSGVCASIHTITNTVAWCGTLGSPVFASPILYDDDKYVVFAEVNGDIHCRTVEKGIKIWKYQGSKGNIFSSLYVKEVDKLKWQMVFGCHDSNVYSINIKNFQPSLHWKTQLTSPVYSTPCGLSDKLILAASNDGKICVIDGETGMILADYQLPGETFSSPAVYGDYIFIGCRNDHLYSLKYVLNL